MCAAWSWQEGSCARIAGYMDSSYWRQDGLQSRFEFKKAIAKMRMNVVHGLYSGDVNQPSPSLSFRFVISMLFWKSNRDTSTRTLRHSCNMNANDYITFRRCSHASATTASQSQKQLKSQTSFSISQMIQLTQPLH